MLRASTYGVLLSLEPAVAAVTGFVIASQRLSPFEIVAIVAVMVAAAGASWTSGEVPVEVPPEVLAEVLVDEDPAGETWHRIQLHNTQTPTASHRRCT